MRRCTFQFGRLRRANPPPTRPIECRTLPQSAAQNTFRILLFPLLFSLLFVEQICDPLSLSAVVVVVLGPSRPLNESTPDPPDTFFRSSSLRSSSASSCCAAPRRARTRNEGGELDGNFHLQNNQTTDDALIADLRSVSPAVALSQIKSIFFSGGRDTSSSPANSILSFA